MAEKSGHKGKNHRRQKIDEDNDVFLSFINKKKRNNKKKLTEIEELEKRDPSTLKPEQFTKIKGKGELSKQNDYWHEIKDLYYQALKTNQDEGTKNQAVKKDSAQPQEKAQHQAQEKPKTDVIRPIVGLFHVHELFGNAGVREEFDKGYMNMSGSLGLTTFPDFKAVQEFAHKVFKYLEADAAHNAGKKLDEAVRHLEHYVSGSSVNASGDKSYAYISDVVSKLVASDFFRSHKAVAHHVGQHVHHHAGHEQPHHHAGHEEHKHEHKHDHKAESTKQTRPESPVKQTHHQEQHKKEEAPVQSAKKDTTHHGAQHKEGHKETQHHKESHTQKDVQHQGAQHKEGHKDTQHHKESHAQKDVQHHGAQHKEGHKETQHHKESHQQKETQRSPQENPENWNEYDEDYDEEEGHEEGDYDEEEEEEQKKPTTQKKPENPDDGFVEVKAKYLEKKKPDEGTRGGRRGGGKRRGGGERRGGDRGESRGGEQGERRRGSGRRRGGGERRGGEGGEGGEYRGYRRRGDGQGYRRRGQGQGKEEYVPKQQQEGTKTQTPTQP